ncbi:MAG: peptidyl-prolyl cis-trans isomerase [Deltaproteobacteria bacterium]|nr:MAG: peptidyl-prolyl cis-trans isomerase [Deltaproteobacteria bacterium]
MGWAIAIALSLLTGTLVACEPRGAGAPGLETPAGDAADPAGEAVLARVDGMSVRVAEFEREARRRARGGVLPEAERLKVLNDLVAEKLLYRAALEAGLDQDPSAQRYLARLMYQRQIDAKVPPRLPDAEVQSYYEAHREEFAIPEGVRLKRILIRVTPERPDADAKAQADRVRAELDADPNAFERLATEHSEDPNLPRGASSHFIRRDEPPWIDREVVNRAFELGVGDLSPVFRTDEGYNIVQTIDHRQRVERSFEQAQSTVHRKLREERRKALAELYLEELRSQASVEVDEARLASIEIAAPGNPHLPTGHPPAGGAGPDPGAR